MALYMHGVGREVLILKATIPAAVLLALAPLIGDAGSSAEKSHIATISLQRIASESVQARAAGQRLEALRQQKGRELGEKQKELGSTHQQLVEAERAGEGSKRAQLITEEDGRRAEILRLTQQAQTDISNLQRQLQADLLGKVNPILADIGTRQGLDAVLNADVAVVWAPRSMDVTAEVLQKLDADAATAAK